MSRTATRQPVFSRSAATTNLTSPQLPSSPAMVATRKLTGNLPPSKRADLAESDNSASETDEHESPKKRVRRCKAGKTTSGQHGKVNAASSASVTARPGSRRRLAGRLAMMMSMPVDVFIEIARYLGPDDLLRLSRASRALRELLLSKSSKLIWSAAEEAIGLPKCPPDLSSPRYASFVFDTFCTHCIKARAYKHIVSLRIRLCQNCTSTQLVRGCTLLRRSDMPRQANKRIEIFLLVPATKKYPTHFYDEWFTKEATAQDFDNYRYYLPHFEAVLKKYLSLERSSVKRKKFVDETREMICQILFNSSTLGNWKRNMKQTKTEDKYKARRNRLISIIAKLEELGYTKDDFSTKLDEKNWKWEILVDQPRALTDRIWRNVRPQLEETIRLRREKNARINKERRAKERRAKLLRASSAFMSSDESDACFVVASELLQLPLAREMIDNDELGSDILQIHWNSLKQQVFEMSETRKLSLEKEAVSMISNTRRTSGLQDIFASVSLKDDSIEAQDEAVRNRAVLQLATSVFKWRNYGNERLVTFTVFLKKLHVDCAETFQYDSGRSFRSNLSAPERCYISIADALYKSIGVSAKTMDDMSALGKSFVCLRCDPLVRELMSWIELVNHFYCELTAFEDLERRRAYASSWKDGNQKIVNVHDHDETKPEELAAYIGTELHTAEKWIKPCTCKTCKSSDRKPRKVVCPICETIAVLSSFSCERRLDVHIDAKHKLEQV